MTVSDKTVSLPWPPLRVPDDHAGKRHRDGREGGGWRVEVWERGKSSGGDDRESSAQEEKAAPVRTMSSISGTPGRICKPRLPSLCNRCASDTIIPSNRFVPSCHQLLFHLHPEHGHPSEELTSRSLSSVIPHQLRRLSMVRTPCDAGVSMIVAIPKTGALHHCHLPLLYTATPWYVAFRSGPLTPKHFGKI